MNSWGGMVKPSFPMFFLQFRLDEDKVQPCVKPYNKADNCEFSNTEYATILQC